MVVDVIRAMLSALNPPILEANMAAVPVEEQRRERTTSWCFLTAMVKPNVAIAIPDLVGQSFDLFGDGGCATIVAKVGGGAAVMGGDGGLKPFPGAGSLDWRISRIDVGGLDRSLAVVGARFPWGVFVLVRPCAAEGVQDRDQVRRGGEGLASSLQVGRHPWS
jgi:hypothetical protein